MPSSSDAQSASMCVASASSAIEFAQNPPIASTMVKANNSASARRRRCSLA